MADKQLGHNHSHQNDHDHGHSHGHDHSHGYDHGVLSGHSHTHANFGNAFAIGVALNLTFVVVEAVYGVLGNSMALLADAGHNLSDVLGLAVAWIAMLLAKRLPTARFTYGFSGSSILAALFNAVFLLVVVGGLSWEAIQRFFEPQPVAGKTVIIVAAIGILLNGFCALLFTKGSKDDLNIRGAFMHMAADALVSAGVVVAGIIILLTGWWWLDPAISLVVNAIIIVGTWQLLTRSLALSLNAVPHSIDYLKVRGFLEKLPGVTGLHDLHIWALSTTENALTCHLVMPGGHPSDAFLCHAAEELDAHFQIGHATFQVETNAANECRLAPDHVV
jgi:cobalt-zinc-cadmium efflux system protein